MISPRSRKDPPEVKKDEEEITSESDAEDKMDQSEKVTQVLKRKIKMADYPDFLAKRHKLFLTYRSLIYTTFQVKNTSFYGIWFSLLQ